MGIPSEDGMPQLYDTTALSCNNPCYSAIAPLGLAPNWMLFGWRHNAITGLNRETRLLAAVHNSTAHSIRINRYPLHLQDRPWQKILKSSWISIARIDVRLLLCAAESCMAKLLEHIAKSVWYSFRRFITSWSDLSRSLYYCFRNTSWAILKVTENIMSGIANCAGRHCTWIHENKHHLYHLYVFDNDMSVSFSSIKPFIHIHRYRRQMQNWPPWIIYSALPTLSVLNPCQWTWEKEGLFLN